MLLERPRFALGIALLLSAAGLIAWFSMPREEDPRLAERIGLVLAPFPGADAEQVERLVVEPLEEHLSEVDAIKEIRVTIRASIAIVNLELEEDVTETGEAWGRVQDALDEAYREMPASAIEPSLDYSLIGTESVVVAISGSADVLALADAADALRRDLLGVSTVSEVALNGDPGEQIVIALDEATSRRFQLPPERLAQLLSARNVSVPGGSIRVGERRVDLRPGAELTTVEELRRTPIVLPSGAAVPLASIADVRRAPTEPVGERARMNGSSAVFVGVIPESGIDAVAFGDEVRTHIASVAERYPELRFEELAYQPDKVEGRLSELGLSLLVGIGIVAFVLLLTMGPRLGTVVASVVPLVVFASIAVYAAGGGVLHQIAVAALVLALGLLVDNAIVMAEAIQRRLDEGQARADAVKGAVVELAVPLASATATTLASFVPMLLAPGTSGDFTRAIPIVVMLTLALSYGYAIAFTPLVSGFVLRPSKNRGQVGWVERAAGGIARLSVKAPVLTLLGVTLVVGGAAAFATQVRFNFFPSSDREQMVVSLALPEGTHLDATDDEARRMERFLAGLSEVRGVATFVGRSGPRFYYNLPRDPQAPFLAQLVVTTGGRDDVTRVMREVRAFAAREMADATVVPRRLEQGPPTAAPVEIRLVGEDLSALHLASEEVQRLLREDARAVDVRANHGPGAPVLGYAIDDAQAARRGLSRVHVATAMLGRTRGLDVGAFRGGEDPVPIVVRAPLAEDHDPAQLDAIGLTSDAGTTSLGGLTTTALRFAPAVIHRLDRRRTVSVLAQTVEGATYAQVIGDVLPALEALELPPGVSFELGGAHESSADANAGLGQKAPIGALLLIAILLAQFNSVRKVAIVLVTAPLAVMGIWPGLFLADLPFGFVALLGAIALIGIVVNGAIVLIDLTEAKEREGMPVAEALEHAVRVRTRPILLTTATTIAGLTPLLFSESTLWPPMASAMISGLTVATALTLFAVPALYRLMFRDPTPKGARA